MKNLSFRLSVSVELTDEDFEKVKNCEDGIEDILVRAMKKGMSIEGESYIPASWISLADSNGEKESSNGYEEVDLYIADNNMFRLS